jgi:hypothetical protein
LVWTREAGLVGQQKKMERKGNGKASQHHGAEQDRRRAGSFRGVALIFGA